MAWRWDAKMGSYSCADPKGRCHTNDHTDFYLERIRQEAPLTKGTSGVFLSRRQPLLDGLLIKQIVPDADEGATVAVDKGLIEK